jgi:DNA-directed RNA polymerase subunit RPC12/RpoP
MNELLRLLERLEAIGGTAPPDSLTDRVYRALTCAQCGAEARIRSLRGTQVEFSCPGCLSRWAIEIPPLPA